MKFLINYASGRAFSAIPTGILRYFSVEGVSGDDTETEDSKLTEVLDAIKKGPSSRREIFDTHIPRLFKSANFSAASRLIKSLHTSLGSEEHRLPLVAAEALSDPIPNGFKFPTRVLESSSPCVYLDLAKAFSKCDDLETLLRLISYLSDRPFPGTITIINRVIFAFAECGQSGKALSIFDHVKKRLKPEPDLFTFNIILGVLGQTCRVDEMLCEFSLMKESGVAPDVVTYNTLLNSLRKMGKYGMCSNLFNEMDGQGIKPDLRTYTSLIESVGRAGNVEESLRLFSEMKLQQIRPSIYVYRSLIANFRKMGKVEIATKLLLEMNSRRPYLIGPHDFKSKHS